MSVLKMKLTQFRESTFGDFFVDATHALEAIVVEYDDFPALNNVNI